MDKYECSTNILFTKPTNFAIFTGFFEWSYHFTFVFLVAVTGINQRYFVDVYTVIDFRVVIN